MEVIELTTSSFIRGLSGYFCACLQLNMWTSQIFFNSQQDMQPISVHILYSILHHLKKTIALSFSAFGVAFVEWMQYVLLGWLYTTSAAWVDYIGNANCTGLHSASRLWLVADMEHSMSCSSNFSCVSFFRTQSSSDTSGPQSSAPGGGEGWSVSRMPSLSSPPLYLFPRSSVLSAVVSPPTLLRSCCHWGEHGGEVGLDTTWSSSFCSSAASSVMMDVQLWTSGLSSSVCLKANFTNFRFHLFVEFRVVCLRRV